ncbi:hypothetical protein DPMN_174336 [Dreissena polymorpha]|uniref:Uncharacterized protein n=1 Tax=Dreissena polymorpha TaxID=45954 RepID=A0A9D4E4J5_DREPO|nr:hypothetical protein DPMN_174336 [Dreissena polymorpha]
MDNPSGSFWIRIEALGDCKPASGHGAAILYYETCEICNENIPLPVGDPFAFTYTGLVRLLHFLIYYIFKST